MKKHLIAAAVAAAVTVPAAAQVTISGTLDTGYATRTAKAAGVSTKISETGFANRGATSTINFSAAEDLGGGLKAAAFINQTLVATDGSMSPRDIWASVGGGFGQVKIGRFAPAFETVTGAHNVTGTVNSAGTADFMYGASLAAASTGYGAGATIYADVGRGLRNTSTTSATLAASGSTIEYTSPAFGGVRLIAGLGKHSTDHEGTAGKAEIDQLDIALTYAAGPLSLGISAVQRTDTNSTGASTVTTEGAVANEIDLRGIGASYKIGSMTVKAGVLMREQKLSSGANKTVDATVTSLGLTMPMGANTFMINYYDGDDDVDGVAANKLTFSGYQVGAYHSLSKRTSVYALYGNDEKKGATTATTHERTDVTIGVRHNF